MVGNITANTKMIRKKALEPSPGLTEENMLGIGDKENNMEKALTLLLKEMRSMESGRMVKELDG